MASVHDRERELTREITGAVGAGLPGVDVLAVELNGRERFTVFVDHADGVDHALCERVTNLLRGYLDRYAIDVSSPGLERPLRTQAHFAAAAGQTVVVRTEHEVAGRKRFRGAVVGAGAEAVTLLVDGTQLEVPYGEVARANLLYEAPPEEQTGTGSTRPTRATTGRA